MNLGDLIRRYARGAAKGSVNVVDDVNAVVAANVGESSGTEYVSTKRTTRVVQRDGRTEVREDRIERRST